MTTVAAIPRFERLFRAVASLDIDRADLRRHGEFVDHKIYDLLLRAVANAKANARDVIEPPDLPITKGLQERIHEFRQQDAQLELRPILDAITRRPPLELDWNEEVEAMLPDIAGGLTVAVARSFPLLEAGLKNPQAAHWERAFALFDLLL